MEALVRISAKDNPSIKLYRQLAKSKKERQKQNCFVLEGLRLVSDAVKNGAILSHLFWTEEGFSRWKNEMPLWKPENARCFLVTNGLGAELAQTEHAQGVYAICRIPAPSSLEEMIHSSGIYAVLHQLQDPGNVGMILRTADAMGLDGVICCNCCDIYSPKVVRATMGSLFRVPVCSGVQWESVQNICRKKKVETCAAVVAGEAELVGGCAFSSGTAIVIGNEGNGLPTAVSQACDRRLTIPMCGTIESLNAAMAAGIILWEASRKRMLEQEVKSDG